MVKATVVWGITLSQIEKLLVSEVWPAFQMRFGTRAVTVAFDIRSANAVRHVVFDHVCVMVLVFLTECCHDLGEGDLRELFSIGRLRNLGLWYGRSLIIQVVSMLENLQVASFIVGGRSFSIVAGSGYIRGFANSEFVGL